MKKSVATWNNKQTFNALTGLRIISAWMIFIYHFIPFGNPKYPQWIKTPIAEFHFAVDIFFVLSGFLIAYRYFNDYPIHFKKYMVNRFARVYPMYLIITSAVFLVWFFQNGYWNTEKTIEAILSFTMTKTLFYDYRFAGIAQGWTLTLEELFYFTAPLYFILIRKSKWWFFALPFIIFFFGTGLSYHAKQAHYYGNFLTNNISFFIFDFFAGIGAALVLLFYRSKIKFKRFTYLGVFFICAYVFGNHFVKGMMSPDVRRPVEIFYVAVFGIAPSIYGLATENTLLSKILGMPIMVLLGKSSYIFYLIHKGFVPVFINDYISDNKLIIFLLLSVLSIVLFKFIEEPLNLYIRRRYGSSKRI